MEFETIAGPLAALSVGYLLGSIPFGLLLTRMAGLGDVRRIGSGNIGATNVLRTGNKALAAATLLLDALKGVAAVLLLRVLFPGEELFAQIAALAAFIGHLYPVWLGFRGGKGVATFLGVMGALYWPCAAIAAVVWLIVLAGSRYSSVAGMSAAVAAPVAAAAVGRFDLALLYFVFALLVFWKHRANIERLLAGTEPRVGRAG
ncbi:MAG: glycerol-3-phosphate 1-O-acyltransferase PlsY [Allosphingosinicella sp.]|uniref:glycerol-3-phosphate 1-O-acyltransferase PlsY n=1 Tax=Allosphingosinicella sp. TaxID=2823234 RepID=UPI003928AAA5